MEGFDADYPVVHSHLSTMEKPEGVMNFPMTPC